MTLIRMVWLPSSLAQPAFVIALSNMSLLGLGPFFWSLVVGTLVTLLLERDAWNDLRASSRTDLGR